MQRRRWPRWLRPAAVAAGIALMGCGSSGSEVPGGSEQAALRQQLRPRLARRVPIVQLEAAVTAGAADAAAAHADLAEALLRQGSLGRCLEVLARGLDHYPDDPRLLYLAGETHRRVGLHDQAIRYLQRLLVHMPRFADGHFSLCSAFAHRSPAAVGAPARIMQADLDSAAAHCGLAASLEPGNPVFHYNRGRALHLQRRYGAAAEAFRKTLELGHAGPDVHRELGKALEKEGDQEGSEASYRAAVTASPTDAEALYLLARALDRRGATAEAVALYRSSLEQRPDVADVHYNLARAQYRLGHEAEGEHHMRLSQELRRGDLPGVHALELAVQRHPEDPERRRALASAHAETGDHGAACEQLRVALALAPQRTDVRLELAAQLRALQQDADGDE